MPLPPPPDYQFLYLLASDNPPITTPGYYVLQNSPNQALGSGTVSAPNILLKIESSGVHIDLNNQVITGSGQLTSSVGPPFLSNNTNVDATIAFAINGDYDNIEIFNGTIQQFSLFGIEMNVYSTSSVSQSLNFHDLIIQQCGNVTNISSSIAAGGGGFSGYNLISGYFQNLQFFSNNYADIYLINAELVHISGIHSAGLRGGVQHASPTSADLENPDYLAYGVECFSVALYRRTPVGTNVIAGTNLLEDIHITNVQSAAAMFGIFLTSNPTDEVESNLHTILRDCQVTEMMNPVADVSSFSITGTAEVRGIAIEGMTSFVQVQNCHVESITSLLTRGPGYAEYDGYWNTITGFNVEGNVGGLWFDGCTVTNIQTAGYIQTTTLTGDAIGQYWLSQFPVTGWYIQGDSINDIRFTRCNASVLNGGASTPQATLTAGYLIENTYGAVPSAVLFEDCAASFVTGIEGSADFLLANYDSYGSQNGAVIFDRCTASNDYLSDTSSATPSRGFSIGCPVHSIVLRDCVSQGHAGHGFVFESRYSAQQNEANFQNVSVQNCLSQANQKDGYSVHSPFVKVSLDRCSAVSNAQHGFFANNQQTALTDCRAEFNAQDGIKIDRYFTFSVSAVSTTPLSQLNLYGGQFTVTSTDDGNTLQLIPTTTTSYPDYPSPLTIGGVPLTVPPNNTDGSATSYLSTGPQTILLLGETPGTNNGVYALQLAAMTFTYDSTATTGVIYQLQRVDPWVVGNTIPAGDQISVDKTEQVYVVKQSVVVGTQVPSLELSTRDKTCPLDSRVMIGGGWSVQNEGCGVDVRGTRGVEVCRVKEVQNGKRCGEGGKKTKKCKRKGKKC